MNKNASLAVVLLAAAGRASAAVLPAPALTGIGVAAAVRGAVRAQAPGQTVGREVASGKPVFLNDHVTTGDGARMQIMLLDQTTFTIGPNSDMVLDEFVYDPNTGAGKVSAQITKGVFRFVTGKVAQRSPSDMKVKLPVGTIGIRGTMVEGSVSGQNADILLTGPGAQNNANERPGGITVSNGGGSTDIDASGYGTSIHGGGAPSAGYRFSPEQVRGIQGALSAPTNAAAGGASRASTQGGGSGNGSTASNGPAAGGSEGVSGSAAQNSGQNTASGGVNFQTTATNLVVANGDTSNFAAQQTQAAVTNPNANSTTSDPLAGVFSWDEILAIPSGTGEYRLSSTYSGVTGTQSPAAITGNYNLIIPVNFATAQLAGNVLGRQAAIAFTSGPITDFQNINSISMSAVASSLPSGTPAVYQLKPGDLATSSTGTGTIAGSVFVFTRTGAAGASASFNMVYHDASQGTTVVGNSTAAKVPIPLF
jgi:hypothetical protein